ncbi:DNA-binding transcriptional regulator, MarR family [Palleronia marisminoris]|uniref:Transcriptional repressor MprA n=1 Tax=Palleronia marisminoris TaxID=315423 RepID=A0A1Y5TKM5_9RHOB|nr:MarR family transcriptional regulator [Palleronia marisminoris]SFH41377.1 DNA-binding transcriptional regulator, MarR family [Palleronia marisminoris]SLN66167.1 transcriptional repressor MprA [Palleronia marisminoris]
MSATDLAAPDEVEAIDLGKIGQSLGFLLRLSQVEVFGMFYRALSCYEMKPGEFSILYVIHLNPGVRQGALAKRLMVKRAQMTKLIRHYERRGLVARTIPEDNRRTVHLHLTDEGTRFVSENDRAFLGYIHQETDRLTPSEAAELTRLLRKFIGLEGTP